MIESGHLTEEQWFDLCGNVYGALFYGNPKAARDLLEDIGFGDSAPAPQKPAEDRVGAPVGMPPFKRLTVHTDVKYTRRKGMHFIMDEEEELRATYQTVANVLNWMLDNDHKIFYVEGQNPDEHFELMLKKA